MCFEEKGELLIEGKTKRVYAVKGNDNLVIQEYTDDITADNDPKKTRRFEGKGKYCNIVNSAIFRLLQRAGIPVAFLEQISLTEFITIRCNMIKLESVIRRIATGSYCDRYPDTADGTRFHRLLAEFFLKTTDDELKSADGSQTLVSGLTIEQGDPLIINPFDGKPWKLVHPKKPSWHAESKMENVVYSDNISKTIFGELGISNNKIVGMMRQMEELTRKVFLVIEGAWNTRGLKLVDLKIEFGIDSDGKLVVADVIDQDSWRLWKQMEDGSWKSTSKQIFRNLINKDDSTELEKVRAQYDFVAREIERIKIPRQIIVCWRGSESDELPKITVPKDSGIILGNVVLSGHKSTLKCLEELNNLEGRYPSGGVIISLVGRSNGLGPTLSAHTRWPVISVPVTYKGFADDIHSSVRMPSDAPNLTAWPASNAVLAALNILALSNPIAYMLRQLRIEELDS